MYRRMRLESGEELTVAWAGEGVDLLLAWDPEGCLALRWSDLAQLILVLTEFLAEYLRREADGRDARGMIEKGEGS